MLPTALLLLLAGCEGNQGVCGNIFEMGPGPDARAVDAGGDARADAAAVARAPFTPAAVTVSQAACLSFQMSTTSGAAGDARRTADLKQITGAGVTLLRGDFLWHRTEKVKGTFDFTGYDRRLAAAEKAGVAHIALLAYGNPWATKLTTSDPYYPPDDPADFANYVAAAVKHYKGRVKIYEIWNEPNGGYRFWKSKADGDPKAYGALLKAAYKAAKIADPTAQVLFGGPFWHDQVIPGHLKFLAAVYAAHPDLSKFYDGMALHPYAIYPPAAAPETSGSWEVPVWEKVTKVRALMAKHGAGSKPIHVTEMGWPIWKNVSEAQQAAYLVRGFLLLLAAGASSHCWYTLHDSKNPSTPTEGTFGLLGLPDAKGVPRQKPAHAAHKVLTGTLGAFRMETDLGATGALPEGVHGYGLRDPKSGRRAMVLWSSAPGAPPVSLKLSSGVGQAEEISMLGVQITRIAKGGAITVTPTAAPVYLLEQASP